MIRTEMKSFVFQQATKNKRKQSTFIIFELN